MLRKLSPTNISDHRALNHHLVLVKATLQTSPYLLALVGLMLVGFGLRVWGIHFGLPYQYHLDEEQYFLDATRFAYSFSLAPDSWANPTFLKYLYFLEYRIFYLFGLLSGRFASITDFKLLVESDPTVFYILARTSVAVLGTLTIPLVYMIGVQSYTKMTGLIASILLATCFLHVRDSHYLVSDVPATFFITAVILFSLLYLQRGQVRYLHIAAILSGLAIATKYTAAITVIPITLAWMLRNFQNGDYRCLLKRPWYKELLPIYAIIGLVFLIVVPYAILDWSHFLQSMRDHYGMGKIPGFAGYKIDTESGWYFYLRTLIWGLGIPLLGISVLGWLYACYRHQSTDIVLVTVSLLFFIFLARQTTFFARFIIPVLPILMVLAARLIWAITQRFARPVSSLILIVLTTMAILQPLAASLRHGWILSQIDTRTLAKQWVEANLAEGSKIYVEWYTPPLATSDQAALAGRTYQVDKSFIVGLYENSLDEYRRSGYDYVIASSYVYNIPRLDPVEHLDRQSFYATLNSEFELVKSYKPFDGDVDPPFVFANLYGPAADVFQINRPGPTIKIYKVRTRPLTEVD